ncbi:ATP-dependent zinc metalloprotease FtsH [Bacteroidia bacterium]|nr:ATP-dependent zinc metalloprotease FtsH [Bacteroidia bacterium]GHT85619.1 ATP-dependent zinc metalloprotease FtsH [Bacteroidia bacterium]GHU83815.1 ATP-dependent zinc metalloprotease FtsH [Bacteroidia bacterium]
MSENDKNNNKKPDLPGGMGPNNNKPFKFNMTWIYGLIIIMLMAVFFTNNTPVNNKDVGWSEFQKLAEDNTFSKMSVNLSNKKVVATIKPELVSGILEPNTIPSFPGKNPLKKEGDATITVTIPSADKFTDFYERWVNKNEINATITYDEGNNLLWSILLNILPVLLLVFLWIFIMRRMSGGGGGGLFSVGKTKAQLYDKSSPQSQKITFKDVAGLSEAKQEVEEIVDFLKKPAKYTDLGAKIPKGALLVGPPGTGKTLLAKAVAGEADVPFFSLSGSDFVEMFVGVGASRVRDLFRQAKEKAPCIVFIDEIDAVGRARGRNPNMGTNDERENTLNQLLTEMDGFGSNSGVIILAATNRVDILDKALLRAGRFDRQINVDLPELNDRKEIFVVHLRNIKIDQSVDTEFMARQTPGFSGADIANVCNEAALIAARNGKEFVQKEDFMNAVDRIVGGLEKKSKVTTVEERRTIAIHEAGHATLSWMLEYANPLVKVTIVPRGKALGAAWYMPEERQITTYQQLQDEMCATLGGRAAEELILGKISTGAANDLERVTKQAYAMVVYYGMSDRLPNLNYYDASGQDWGFSKPYSDDTARLIDEEVKRIISEQYTRAKSILTESSNQHKSLTDVLLEREVIYADDLEKIFGKRKWLSRSQEILEQQGLITGDEVAAQAPENPEEKAPEKTA